MRQFSIYTKIGCPYCTKVIGALELAEQQFVEYKMGRDFTREEFYEKFGEGSTFPRVICGEDILGGCQETVKYLKENELI